MIAPPVGLPGKDLTFYYNCLQQFHALTVTMGAPEKH